jgi:hypothetical protein
MNTPYNSRSLSHFVDFLHIHAKNPGYRAPLAVCRGSQETRNRQEESPGAGIHSTPIGIGGDKLRPFYSHRTAPFVYVPVYTPGGILSRRYRTQPNQQFSDFLHENFLTGELLLMKNTAET